MALLLVAALFIALIASWVLLRARARRARRPEEREIVAAPEVAADQPPRCPPNYHWDESIRGCVPDGEGPYTGVREPLRPRRPGPTLTAEDVGDRED